MKLFLSIKFYKDASNLGLIRKIISAGKKQGHVVRCIFTDYEDDGKKSFPPKELMQLAFEEIKKCDALVVEFSEKGVGLGIEAGYAFSKGLPIFVIAKKEADVSGTLMGIAKKVVLYDSDEDLELFFKEISI